MNENKNQRKKYCIDRLLKHRYFKLASSPLILLLLSAFVISKFNSCQIHNEQINQEIKKNEEYKTDLIEEISSRMDKIHDILTQDTTDLTYIFTDDYKVIVELMNGEFYQSHEFQGERLVSLLRKLQKANDSHLSEIDRISKDTKELDDFLLYIKISRRVELSPDYSHTDPVKFRELIVTQEKDKKSIESISNKMRRE